MKLNTITLSAALVLLLILTAAMAHHTQIAALQAEHQAELATEQERADQAQATSYWLRMARWREYQMPVDNLVVSSGVGFRADPMGGTDEALHKGLDFVGELGDPVYACMSGVVVEHWLTPGWHNGLLYRGHPVYGAKIVLMHGRGLYSIYAHMSATFVHTGDYIAKGQIIGAIGHTGMATGDHLHWELVLDPLEYLEGR